MEDTLCPATDVRCCPAPPRPTLRELRERFDREAYTGMCDTGRYDCHYFVWGKGPPMLMIPGMADDSQSFLQLASELASSFRCIAYDLPTGRGDRARLRRYTHDALAADALALLDHLQCPRSYVFGSSLGSTIALAAMHKRPERLPRGILQGGFARRPLSRIELCIARLLRACPGRAGSLPLRAEALRRANARAFADLTPEMWEHFLSRSQLQPIAAIAHRALLIHRLDLRALLPSIRQPILLISGDHDAVVDRSCDRVLAEGLPRATRVELINCGHNPLFSHAEMMAELVRQFLTPPEAD